MQKVTVHTQAGPFEVSLRYNHPLADLVRRSGECGLGVLGVISVSEHHVEYEVEVEPTPGFTFEEPLDFTPTSEVQARILAAYISERQITFDSIHERCDDGYGLTWGGAVLDINEEGFAIQDFDCGREEFAWSDFTRVYENLVVLPAGEFAS